MAKESKPYKFNPIKDLDLSIPKDKQAEALRAASEFIKETMLDYIGEMKSPVSGGRWVKTLSTGYLKKKEEESGVSQANLELTGHLLDNLSVDVKGSNIVIDVDPEDRGKALGHLTGEYGKHSKEKPRQFMPQPGQEFKKQILSDLKQLLSEYEDN